MARLLLYLHKRGTARSGLDIASGLTRGSIMSPAKNPANRSPGPTGSAWSFVSWFFVGLTVLGCVGMAVCGLILLATATDPLGGPLVGISMLVGMEAAGWVALVCATVGTVCGLIGLLTPAHRTASAWIALALNVIFVFVSVVLLLLLSSGS
jgi:hypothetical protein